MIGGVICAGYVALKLLELPTWGKDLGGVIDSAQPDGALTVEKMPG